LLNGAGGADGFSFNFGQNLTTAFTPEEGATSGLSVTVDTFDNGALPSNNNTPAEVGIEAKWNGVRLSFTPVDGGTINGPPDLERNVFVDATVDVTPGGLMTFTYDTFVTQAQIPGYSGLIGNT